MKSQCKICASHECSKAGKNIPIPTKTIAGFTWNKPCAHFIKKQAANKRATAKPKSKVAKATAVAEATKRLKTLNKLSREQLQKAGTKSIEVPRISYREAQKRAGRVFTGRLF